jgi:hypothetical protein
MVGNYEEATDEFKVFWLWVMMDLMPCVSKTWANRVAGKKIRVLSPVGGVVVDEHLSHYLTTSDFAYIPVVVAIFGERELLGGKRKPGRTPGQGGMTKKENIALYVSSLLKMREVFESDLNDENVCDWGNIIFGRIDAADGGIHALVQEVDMQRFMAESTVRDGDYKKWKKDELLIPV